MPISPNRINLRRVLRGTASVPDALTAVVNPSTAAKIRKHFESEPTTESTLRVLS